MNRRIDQPARDSATSRGADVSRRTFLRGTTLTAAAVGVAAAVPSLPGLLASGSAEAPVIEESVPGLEEDGAGVSGPLLAHVKDVATGEISLFQGEREVVIRDLGMARRLATSIR